MMANPTTTATTSPLMNKDDTVVADTDTALFGSLNASIADTMTDRIDTALKAGVSTLPLMNSDNGSRSESMLSCLQRIYHRNVDVFEVYAGRNIFSVGMYPPKRRRAIVDLYNMTIEEQAHQKEQGDSTKAAPLQDVSASKMNKMSDDTSNNKLLTDLVPPQSDQLPTAQQRQELKEEMTQLREKLLQVKRRRNETTKALNEFEVAEQLADMAGNSVQEETAGDTTAKMEQVHDSITTMVVGGEGLKQKNAQGEELLQELDRLKQSKDEKRQRGENDGEDEDDIELLVAPKKKKELTLEERYQEAHKTFSNPESLARVHQMIREQ
jgi:hypothetical protein